MQVKTLTGRKHSFTMEGTSTIADVKRQLMEKEGIDAKQIRLIYSGKQLNDTDTLDAAGIKAGETIHMVLHLRGGRM